MNINFICSIFDLFQIIRKFAWMKLRNSKKLNKNIRISVTVIFFIILHDGKFLGIPTCNTPEVCDRYYPFIYVFDIKRKDIFTKTSLEKLIIKNRVNIFKLFDSHSKLI